jgi:hypothetical protein
MAWICSVTVPERSVMTVRWRAEVARSATDAPSSAAPAPRLPTSSEAEDAIARRTRGS